MIHVVISRQSFWIGIIRIFGYVAVFVRCAAVAAERREENGRGR
jgi:hypothetical protein